MHWSIEGQTAEFLAVTRAISLSDRIVSAILEHLELRPGMRVLDVGCGSGEYCFRLGQQLQGVLFTGLDQDERFVRFASARADGEVGYPFEVPNAANGYRFVCADGCALPFSDGAFDAVVSHTYLTAIPNWQGALREMRRVCKLGATVSSVTSMTDDFFGTGTIELLSAPLAPREAELVDLVRRAKTETFGSLELTQGIAPRSVPAAFDQAGFARVRCMPLAQYFCLDDAATTDAERRRHVDLLRAMELEELARLGDAISERTRRDYERLVERRCAELEGRAQDKREWNWYGNTSLLVCGDTT